MSKESRLWAWNMNQVQSLEGLHKTLTTEFNRLEIFRRSLLSWPAELSDAASCARRAEHLGAQLTYIECNWIKSYHYNMRLQVCACNLKSITEHMCPAAVRETVCGVQLQMLITACHRNWSWKLALTLHTCTLHLQYSTQTRATVFLTFWFIIGVVAHLPL